MKRSKHGRAQRSGSAIANALGCSPSVAQPKPAGWLQSGATCAVLYSPGQERKFAMQKQSLVTRHASSEQLYGETAAIALLRQRSCVPRALPATRQVAADRKKVQSKGNSKISLMLTTSRGIDGAGLPERHPPLEFAPPELNAQQSLYHFGRLDRLLRVQSELSVFGGSPCEDHCLDGRAHNILGPCLAQKANRRRYGHFRA